MSDSNSTPDQKKRPFTEPTLVTYGDVRQITRNVGMASNQPDGGTGSTKKTY